MRFILRILINIAVNAIALWVTTLMVPDIRITGGISGLLIVAIIFGLVNAFIRPVVKLLTLPINILTLGLFTLVINALMLMLTAWLSGNLDIQGGVVQIFVTAFLGSIIISIVSMVLNWILPD